MLVQDLQSPLLLVASLLLLVRHLLLVAMHLLLGMAQNGEWCGSRKPRSLR